MDGLVPTFLKPKHILPEGFHSGCITITIAIIITIIITI